MKKELFILFCILALSPLSAQQYWKDFFFLYDPSGFDSPPYMGMELSDDQAASVGTYTVVLMEGDSLVEALSYVSNNPEYFYSFHYNNEGSPILRQSFYVDDFLELSPLNDLYYYYDQNGLLAVSLFEYSLFDKDIKSRQFTKVRTEEGMRYMDAFQISTSEILLNQFNEMEKEIDQSIPQYQPVLLSSDLN